MTQAEPPKLRLRRDPPVAASAPDAATTEAGSSCPDCQAPMESDAILCIRCGYDSRTNAKIGQKIHEEPAAWRRFIGWNPPEKSLKSMLLIPLILALFFFSSLSAAISTMISHNQNDELLKSGIPGIGIATGYEERTTRKSRSKSHKLLYQYFSHNGSHTGKRDIDVEDLRRIENSKEPLAILYDKKDPNKHCIKGLPPENPHGVVIGLIIALLAFGITWWEYFLPARGHRF